MIIRFILLLFLFCSFVVHAEATVNKRVNLNTADRATLQTLKGIGPKKANAIIDYRTHKDNFHRLEDLLKVKGFTQQTLAKLKTNNPERIEIGEVANSHPAT